jgi:hypothetical protein
MQPSSRALSDPDPAVFDRAWDEFDRATQARRVAHWLELAKLAEEYQQALNVLNAHYQQSIEPERAKREATIREGARR